MNTNIKNIGGISGKIEGWLKISKGREFTVLGSLIGGITLIVINFFFLYEFEQIFTILNLVGAVIVVGPPTMISYIDYRTSRKIENMFPNFLNDIVGATEAGMTLPQAIKAASKNEYGPLSPYVKKMAIQVDWGVPFEQILRNTSKSIRSKLLTRTISTIIETHRSGGNISDVLKSVGESVTEVEKIKEERKAHVYSQIITGYVIYFVFLGVIIGLQKFLIPTLSVTEGAEIGFGGGVTGEGTAELYKTVFQNLIILQGLFSGLAIGKMSEGSIMAGIKHVFVFIAIGFTAFTLML